MATDRRDAAAAAFRVNAFENRAKNEVYGLKPVHFNDSDAIALPPPPSFLLTYGSGVCHTACACPAHPMDSLSFAHKASPRSLF